MAAWSSGCTPKARRALWRWTRASASGTPDPPGNRPAAADRISSGVPEAVTAPRYGPALARNEPSCRRHVGAPGGGLRLRPIRRPGAPIAGRSRSDCALRRPRSRRAPTTGPQGRCTASRRRPPTGVAKSAVDLPLRTDLRIHRGNGSFSASLGLQTVAKRQSQARLWPCLLTRCAEPHRARLLLRQQSMR